MALLDRFGRPVSTKQLATDQVEAARARAGGAQAHAVWTPVTGGMTAASLARRLRAGAMGDLHAHAVLFQEMLQKDLLITGELAKRHAAVAGLAWIVSPADDSAAAAQVADTVQRALEAVGMRDVLRAAMMAVGLGVSTQEIHWEGSTGQWMPTRLEYHDLKLFAWMDQGRTVGLARPGQPSAEPLLPWKWLVHRHGVWPGAPFCSPLLRLLAWPYLFRNYALAAWARHVERHGSPTVVGTYPVTATDREQDTLLAACEAFSSESAIIKPEGMRVEVLESPRAGGNGLHERLLDWSGRQISIAVLGQTLTTDTHGGSYALGQVHDSVRWDLVRDDAAALAAAIQRDLVIPVAALNHGPQKAWPTLAFDLPEPVDQERLAKIISTLAATGLDDIPVWWLRDKFGLPAPAEGELTLADLRRAQRAKEAQGSRASVGQMAVQASHQASSVASHQASSVASHQASSVASPMVLADQAAPGLVTAAHAGLVAPLVQALRQCTSFEDAFATLDALNHPGTEALGGSLARAAFVAGCQGGLDGQQAGDEEAA